MIKFFRHIRQKLLNENRISKYLLYAIGEIILVVIGILIALQINTWNEKSKTDETIKKYHQNLIENLKTDIESFQRIKEIGKFRYYSAQYLLKIAGSKTYDPAKDNITIFEWEANPIWNQPIPVGYDSIFVEKAFLWTHRVTFRNSNLDPTIEELKSTGNYSKLDKSLKDTIETYYEDLRFGFGTINKQVFHEIRSEWQSSLREDGVHNSDPYMFGDPMELLTNNPRRLALLRKFAMESSWHAMRADIVVENSKNLISLIEQKTHD